MTKKIHALALAAMLALSMSAFADGKSCEKAAEHCKTKCESAEKKECCKDTTKCAKHAEGQGCPKKQQPAA